VFDIYGMPVSIILVIPERGRPLPADLTWRRSIPEAAVRRLTLKPGSGLTLGGMSGLGVSELAERAGVAPSTVRFYERAGVLTPASRAANGYRVFEESALDELAFIVRARRIGMCLADIGELVAAWPAGECRSLRARLQSFLAGRIGQVHEQLADLSRLRHQLQAAHGRLGAGDPGPGRCGADCDCTAGLDAANAADLADLADLADAAGEPEPGGVPAGCTLGPRELAARRAEWQAAAAAATAAERGAEEVRLTFAPGPDEAAALARLCAAETDCCSRTRFVLEISHGQLILTVTAPGAPGLLDAIFAHAAAGAR
jgi:MerR family copper efflux transcriptional regulator